MTHSLRHGPGSHCIRCSRAVKKVGRFWRDWYGHRLCADRWFGLGLHKPGQWRPFGEGQPL